MNFVNLSDVIPTPWRNGGGTTRDLLVWPPGASGDDWLLRASVAEVVKDGAFSIFEGVDRRFSVLKGAGVRLSLGGVTHTLTVASAPFEFDGGVACDCEVINGATQDFNLLLKRSRARGSMRLLDGRIQKTLIANKLIAAYAIDTLSTLIINSKINNLAKEQFAWIELAKGTTIYAAPSPGGRMLLIEVELL